MFIISVIAIIVFIISYIHGIMGLILTMEEFKDTDPNPILIFNTIFSPAVIISGVILGISSLVYRVLGIVYVARNKNVSDGEKALWIVGFIIMGFVTAIVFLIMAKGKKFVD
jgi:tellurite resistance protein TehA-like permease